MRALGSVDAVAAAVRDDAAVELEKLERETQAKVSALEAAPAAAVEATDREERISAALRAAREELAQEDLRDAQEALLSRERWFSRAAALGRELLAAQVSDEERRGMLARLAREAISRVPPGALTLHFAARDSMLLDDALLRELGATRGESVDISGGCIARNSRLSADNSFEERARRSEGELRTALGKLYLEARA